MTYFIDQLGRVDSAENVFLRKELEAVREKAFDYEFPELSGRRLLPIDHSVGNGAATVSFATYESAGRARVGSDYTTEAPRVDLKISEQSQRVVGILDSYGYSIQDIRTALEAGRPLSALKARVAKEVIETELNKLMLLGSTAEGLAGLLNLSGGLTYSVPNGVGGVSTWFDGAGKTPAEIYKDMTAMIKTVTQFSNKVERPDTLLLPDSCFDHVSETNMGTGSDLTILEYFRRNMKNVDVESVTEAETAGAASVRRMMSYSKKNTKLQGIIPQEFETFKPQEIGLQTVVNCHARWGGIENYRPKAVCYGDDI